MTGSDRGDIDRSDQRGGPEIVVLGNLIVDDVVYPDGRTRMGQAGGAVVHFALGAALWEATVGIVSVVGDDYPEAVLEGLSNRGIDLQGVRRRSGPGMRTWLLYEGERRRTVHRLSSPGHETMSPAIGDMPTGWSPACVHLAPMPLAHQKSWLDHLRQETSAFLSVDPFELIREENWDACIEAFRNADALLPSEDELLLSPETDQRPLWLNSGIPFVLVKQGSAGGVVFDSRHGQVFRWAPRAPKVVDQTGAGDAFAGGLVAGLARGETMEQALEWAVVSASFTLESATVEAMLDVAVDDAASRHRSWFG